MLPRHPLYARTYEAAKGLHDPDLRRKLFCLLRGMKLRNVELTCRQFGIGRSTYYSWLDRLKRAAFSSDALRPQRKTPHTQPRKIEGALVENILSLRYEFHYGPARLAWYLHRMGFPVSAHGVYNVLKREGVTFRKRRDQKPNRHTRRYELDRPGQGFQLDIKYVPFRIQEKKAYVFSAIDECTRWRFSYAYRHLGTEPALDFVRRLAQASPFSIQRIQTDNGIEFTNRFNRMSPDYTVEHPFPALLRTLKILHKLIPPGIKELNGKVERSFKTDDQEFYWKIPRSITFGEFKTELERWTVDYNYHRPHSSLGMRTPMERLSDFASLESETKRILEARKIDQEARPSLAKTLALRLRSAGKAHPYFNKYLPKKRRLTGTEILLRLSQPLPPLCGFCGNSTWVLGTHRV